MPRGMGAVDPNRDLASLGAPAPRGGLDDPDERDIDPGGFLPPRPNQAVGEPPSPEGNLRPMFTRPKLLPPDSFDPK